MSEEGVMTVQLYEVTSAGIRERGDVQTLVSAVIASYGDDFVQISLSEDRRSWEIEVVGVMTTTIRTR